MASGKPLTEMTPTEQFEWLREKAPSAGEITIADDLIRGERVVTLRGATDEDAERLRTALGLWSSVIGPTRVEVKPAKPHLYFWHGHWWVQRQPRGQGIDASRPTFPEACHLAMLAAIHSGVWRA